MSPPGSTMPGCVLAAGASTRMGSPKALLRAWGADGPTFLELIVRRLDEAGCAPLMVVTREELLSPVRQLRLPITIVVNPAPARGQLSSLQMALASLAGAESPVLMTLVDVPFVCRDTIVRLCRAWEGRRPPLVRPVFAGRHGHPVIFGPEPIEALRRADPASSAKPIVRRFAPLGLDVDVDDAGVLHDIDTPEEYEAHVKGGPPPWPAGESESG